MSRFFLLLLVAGMLSACSGGEQNSPEATEATVPVQSAEQQTETAAIIEAS